MVWIFIKHLHRSQSDVSSLDLYSFYSVNADPFVVSTAKATKIKWFMIHVVYIIIEIKWLRGILDISCPCFQTVAALKDTLANGGYEIINHWMHNISFSENDHLEEKDHQDWWKTQWKQTTMEAKILLNSSSKRKCF